MTLVVRRAAAEPGPNSVCGFVMNPVPPWDGDVNLWQQNISVSGLADWGQIRGNALPPDRAASVHERNNSIAKHNDLHSYGAWEGRKPELEKENHQYNTDELGQEEMKIETSKLLSFNSFPKA